VKLQNIAIAALLVCCATFGAPAAAQVDEVLVQKDEGGPVRPLSADDRARLQDPFFKLVLARQPRETKLAAIEALIQPDRTKRRIFVVHEEIKDPRRPQSRRAVIDFTGSHPDGTRLDRNVMLSINISSERVAEITDIEVWGWDDVNGVYNYYKLDRAGTEPNRSWKLRATSRDADTLRADQREGSCLGCHIIGAPIMKELLFPWNNWHSGRSPVDYLNKDTPAERRWPVATDPGLSGLDLAENLESAIMASIKAFNNRRFGEFARPDGQGGLVVQDARRLLRPLFETVEFNIVSNSQPSGMHPLTDTPQTGPNQQIAIPNSFFLAAALLGGGRDLAGSSGLGIEEARQFNSVAVIQPAEYKALIERSGVKIRTSNPARTLRGDTHFAWFSVEPSFVASSWVDTLLQQKLLTPGFVAAVLAADLETPIFSAGRAGLLGLVPQSFTARPGEAHPDALTRDIIAKLQASNPASGSVEAEFLTTLRAADPVSAVRARIVAYKDRVAQRLANPGTRQAELDRLFGLLIERRRAVVNHPTLGSLVESNALFPLP
jgi:hypothetical protein